MTTSRETPPLPHLRQNGILSPYRAAGRLKPATLSKRKKQHEPYSPFLRPYSANSRILPHRRNLRHHRRSIACRRRIRLAVCRVARRRKQHVLIGMGTIILDDTVIEDDVMIGAGSLVPPRKRLESGYLYVGSPVKQVRLLTEKEKEFLKYSSAHYVRLSGQHKQSK